MFAKGRTKGTVRFSIKTPSPARKVALAGSFNNWQPQAMRKQKDGTYALSVQCASGVHEYKFLCDNEWIVDPDNNHWAMNQFGTFNSVANVE